MGGGSSSSTSSAKWGFSQGYSKTDPWDVQEGYLKDIFSDAKSVYDANKAEGPWGGDYLSPSTDLQRQQGTSVIDQAGKSQSALDTALRSSLGQLTSGQNWQQNAANTIGGLTTDQTGNIIDRAGRYVSGLDLDALTKAGMAAGVRTASESVLPNLYRQTAAGGNINSDRMALSQGVVQRGLAEGAQNLRSTLGADAYKWGVGQGASDLQQQLAAALGLGQLGSTAYGQGQAGVSNAINQQGMIDTRRLQAGDYLKALDQNDLNNELMKYQGRQDFGWNQLANLYNLIGNKSWGQDQVYAEVHGDRGEETTRQNPSPMSTVGSLLGTAGSLIGTGPGGGGGLLGGFKSLFAGG